MLTTDPSETQFHILNGTSIAMDTCRSRYRCHWPPFRMSLSQSPHREGVKGRIIQDNSSLLLASSLLPWARPLLPLAHSLLSLARSLLPLTKSLSPLVKRMACHMCDERRIVCKVLSGTFARCGTIAALCQCSPECATWRVRCVKVVWRCLRKLRFPFRLQQAYFSHF